MYRHLLVIAVLAFSPLYLSAYAGDMATVIPEATESLGVRLDRSIDAIAKDGTKPLELVGMLLTTTREGKEYAIQSSTASFLEKGSDPSRCVLHYYDIEVNGTTIGKPELSSSLANSTEGMLKPTRASLRCSHLLDVLGKSSKNIKDSAMPMASVQRQPVVGIEYRVSFYSEKQNGSPKQHDVDKNGNVIREIKLDPDEEE